MTKNRLKDPQYRIWLWPIAFIAVVALTSTALARGGGHPWHDGHGRHQRGGHFDAERMRERVDFRIEYGLRKLDATTEQQDQILSITDAAFADLIRLHEAHPRPRAELQSLISAETLDREGLEALRKGQLTMVDQFSRRLLEAATDSLAVLTQEQRQKLLEHVERHRD